MEAFVVTLTKSERKVKIRVARETAAPLKRMIILRSRNLKMEMKELLLHFLVVLIFLYIPESWILKASTTLLEKHPGFR